MSQSVYSIPGGVVVTNREELGAVATKTWTVPEDKKWLLLGARFERDASATFNLEIKDEDGNALMNILTAVGAGTSLLQYPIDCVDPEEVAIWGHLWLSAGMLVVATWGATQTSPLVALIVLEV